VAAQLPQVLERLALKKLRGAVVHARADSFQQELASAEQVDAPEEQADAQVAGLQPG
jgi:hypothetical protein